jgi:hypothetical protein
VRSNYAFGFSNCGGTCILNYEMVENLFKRYNKKNEEFEELKTETYQRCLSGDARTIDIISVLSKKQKYSKYF